MLSSYPDNLRRAELTPNVSRSKLKLQTADRELAFTPKVNSYKAPKHVLKIRKRQQEGELQSTFDYINLMHPLHPQRSSFIDLPRSTPIELQQPLK